MKRVMRFVGIGAVVTGVAILGLWGGLAIWFRAPFPETARMVLACLFGLVSLATIIALFGANRWRVFGVFAVLLLGLLVWWASLKPPSALDWSPDVSRQVTGVIDGDTLTLTNVREFEWRSKTDFTERWTTRSFDLSQLQTTDLFLSYWAGPAMAHFILSFGFADGEYLAWSVEVRRKNNDGFSPLADFFKEHTLSIVAATEQDVVGVRTNVRGEDVQLFRLNTPTDKARALLEKYVLDANALAEKPHWYNSITTNCTTVVFQMMKAVGDGRRFDWRIIVNGYLPEYGYERGTVNTDVPLAELRELGRIAPRALAAGLGPQFSTAIREGVPSPH